MFKATETGIVIEGEPWNITLDDHAEIEKIFADAADYNMEEKVDGKWQHMTEDDQTKRLL